MTCHTTTTTNEKLEHVTHELSVLIDWAHADADHAADNDAPETAADDMTRARTLRRALRLLEECRR